MKLVPLLFSLFFVLAATSDADAQAGQKMSAVDDVYARYPERVDAFLSSLDLDRPGLESVMKSLNQNKPVEACKALLDYFRSAETARHLRRAQPAPTRRTNTEADSILQGIFTFYDLPAKVPNSTNGQLDWTYKGPDDDIEWAWGLNRHGHLITLLESYFDTGNPVYAMTINDHIQDWVVASVPYPGVKSNTAQWRGLEVALRAKVWVRVFFGLLGSDHLSPATQILMLSSLPDHTHYMRNFHAPSGNWLTMEMSGLAMVATAWPEFKESAQWVSYAKRNMLEGLKDQVYPDGVQKELTSHYHQVAWYNFDHFRQICEEAGEELPVEYGKELEKMLHYVAVTMRPTGYGILNNDSDNRYNRDHILETAAAMNREDWLFIASNGKKGTRPEGPPSVVFPWAGQLVMRSGYDKEAQWAFFDIGPWGTGHQHDDKLHLSVTAYGRDLLVDAGRFAYRGAMADKFRKYATGSSSHNVLLIDGAGQEAGPRVTTSALPADHYRLTDEFDYASGNFDRFWKVPGETSHTRAIFYVRGKFWVVVDRVQTDRPRKIEALWHWHPDCKVVVSESIVTSTDNVHGNLNIIPVGRTEWEVSHVKGQEHPEPQGWYSEKYNKAEPSPATIYSTNIKSSETFVWILHPSSPQLKPLKAKIVSSGNDQVTMIISDDRFNQWEVVVPFANSAKAGFTFKSVSGK